MYNQDDIETICLYRFGNTDLHNMNATKMFIAMKFGLLWDVAGSISSVIIEGVR